MWKEGAKNTFFGSVFRSGYTRNSSGVLIYLSLGKIYGEESVLKQLLGLKGHHIQADVKICILVLGGIIPVYLWFMVFN